jgi:hypothetical protein
MIRGNQTSMLAGEMTYNTIDIVIICMVCIVALMVAHAIEDWKKTSTRVYRIPHNMSQPTVVTINNREQTLSPIRRPKYSDSFEV